MATPKPIEDMTDEELDALSPEDMLELQNGAPPDGDEGDDGDGETDADREKREADEAAAAEAAAGGNEGGDEETEAERLQRLADEEEGEDAGGNQGETIPRARFNEKSQEAKVWKDVAIEALRGRAPAEQPQQEVTPAPERPVFDFKAANREYHKLLTEGEDEQAAAKLDAIEDAREALQKFDLEQVRINARAEAVQEMTQQQETKAIGQVTKDLYKLYPFLNNAGKAPDEAAILAVNAKAHALVKAGKSASEAIREAGESIGSRFAKVNGVNVPVDKVPEGKTPGKVAEPRTAEAVRRGLEVRQPATQKSGVGNREQLSKLDISNMTDEQLDKLEKSDPDAFAELLGNNRIPA